MYALITTRSDGGVVAVTSSNSVRDLKALSEVEDYDWVVNGVTNVVMTVALEGGYHTIVEVDE